MIKASVVHQLNSANYQQKHYYKWITNIQGIIIQSRSEGFKSCTVNLPAINQHLSYSDLLQVYSRIMLTLENAGYKSMFLERDKSLCIKFVFEEAMEFNLT